MEASGYVTLGRQSGLMAEMEIVAHNIANISTTGFRREGMIFSEYVSQVDDGPSLSMAFGNARAIDLGQAGLSQTGGRFDFALQGEGFFQLSTPQGVMLSRAGSFTPLPTGELVSPDGFPLLDQGGAPVFVPPDARLVSLAQDGTLSADGTPLARLGVVRPVDVNSLRHQMGTLFQSPEVEAVARPVVLQGFLEDSNVNAITEVARMIEVQRAYEMGQGFLDREDERQRNVIQTLGR